MSHIVQVAIQVGLLVVQLVVLVSMRRQRHRRRGMIDLVGVSRSEHFDRSCDVSACPSKRFFASSPVRR